MSNTPIFNSPSQAIEVIFSIVVRLSRLVVWALIALAHLAVLVLALTACWLMGVTATDVVTAYQQLRQTMPAEVLSFVGVTAASLLGAWLWALRKVQAAIGGTWLANYLMKDL